MKSNRPKTFFIYFRVGTLGMSLITEKPSSGLKRNSNLIVSHTCLNDVMAYLNTFILSKFILSMR